MLWRKIKQHKHIFECLGEEDWVGKNISVSADSLNILFSEKKTLEQILGEFSFSGPY